MKKNNLTRGLRNNNPGNIRINGDLFQGEVRPSKDKSFKQFETMAYGYRAMFVILRNYIRNYKLDTIRKMIAGGPRQTRTIRRIISGWWRKEAVFRLTSLYILRTER